MMRTIVYGAGGIVGIGVLAYLTRSWWRPKLQEPRQKIRSEESPSYMFEKEHVECLSYERILKITEQALDSLKMELVGKEGAKLMVMPNKVARDYLKFAKNHGQHFFIPDGQLEEDEIGKMVVVLITTSESMDGILWGKIFIPNDISADFHDFIPEDKLYTRLINVGGRKEDDDTAKIIPLTNLIEREPDNTFEKILQSCTWLVSTKFTLDTLTEYIIDAVEKFPKYELQSVGISMSSNFHAFIQEMITKGEIDVTNDVVKQVVDRLKKSSDNGEAFIFCLALDPEGNECVENFKFLKAESYDTKIQEALEQGKIYKKIIKVSE